MPSARTTRIALVPLVFSVAALLALVAGPALAYTIYLKDGSKLVATEKYKVVGEKAIVKLANGAETMLALAEIDVARTEKGNEQNLGTATVIEGGKTQDLGRNAAPPPGRTTLQDLIKQREAVPNSGPTTIDHTAPARRPREDGGASELSDVVGRSPLKNVALAETIRTFLFGRGISSVEVLQGPTAKRPLLVFSTGTEGQVFKALNASATALLHVRDKSPGDVDSFEVVCRAPDGGGAGRFTMTPPQAQDLVAGRIEMPAFYVKYVQF